MTKTIKVSQAWATAHNGYTEGEFFINVRQTIAGDYVTNADAKNIFPGLFEGTSFPEIEVTENSFQVDTI